MACSSLGAETSRRSIQELRVGMASTRVRSQCFAEAGNEQRGRGRRDNRWRCAEENAGKTLCTACYSESLVRINLSCRKRDTCEEKERKGKHTWGQGGKRRKRDLQRVLLGFAHAHLRAPQRLRLRNIENGNLLADYAHLLRMNPQCRQYKHDTSSRVGELPLGMLIRLID